MKKIKTIFERNWQGDKTVIDQYVPGISAEILGFDNTVKATEKVDGMNIRVTVRQHTVVRVEKRRNPDKIQKAKGIEEPWYVDADPYAPGDKYIFEAVSNTDFTKIPDGEWSAEAYGKNIQGNPLGIENNRLYIFSYQPCIWENVPTTYAELKAWMPEQKTKVGNPEKSIEGIVWHCSNGEMYKIKAKDFFKDNRN